MLKIIKRSGKTEDFCPNKIKTSLAATSDDANEPLTEGDLNVILNELMEMLKDRAEVTSKQVYIILVGILVTSGFLTIAKDYMSFKGNAWSGR